MWNNTIMFEVKLWIGDRYFGTQGFNEPWDMMNTIKDLEALQVVSTPKVNFELYILTPYDYNVERKDQEQVTDVKDCIIKPDSVPLLSIGTNHFVHAICCSVPIVNRPELVKFLTNHGIKNANLILKGEKRCHKLSTTKPTSKSLIK